MENEIERLKAENARLEDTIKSWVNELKEKERSMNFYEALNIIEVVNDEYALDAIEELTDKYGSEWSESIRSENNIYPADSAAILAELLKVRVSDIEKYIRAGQPTLRANDIVGNELLNYMDSEYKKITGKYLPFSHDDSGYDVEFYIKRNDGSLEELRDEIKQFIKKGAEFDNESLNDFIKDVSSKLGLEIDLEKIENEVLNEKASNKHKI